MKNLLSGLLHGKKDDLSNKKIDEKKDLKLENTSRPSSPVTVGKSRNFGGDMLENTIVVPSPIPESSKGKSLFGKSPLMPSYQDVTLQDEPFQGWFLKPNKKWGGWKKKWFILDNKNVLSYFRSKDASEVVGTYDLFQAHVEEINIQDDQMEAYTKFKEDQLKHNTYKITPKGQFKEKDDFYRVAIVSNASNKKGNTIENRVTILDCLTDENRKNFLKEYKRILGDKTLSIHSSSPNKISPPIEEVNVEKTKKKFSLFKEHAPEILDNTPPPRFASYPYCAWFLKPNANWGGWKKKFFVLNPQNVLVYYRNKDSHEEMGSYDLNFSYIEEININNDDLHHYIKVKEEQLKNGAYIPTVRGDFKETPDLFRIALISPSAIQKGVVVENRVTVVDCVTSSTRANFLAAYKKILENPYKSVHEQNFTSDDLKKTEAPKKRLSLFGKAVNGLKDLQQQIEGNIKSETPQPKEDTPHLGETKLKKLLQRHESTGNDKNRDIYTGFLLKKNKHWNGWKKKWFVLNHNLTLSYYRKENNLDEVVGVYELKQSHLEEISIVDSDIEAYSKRKEEEMKTGKYKPTPKNTFKEKEDSYRLGIITTSSYQKGITVENRVTVIDCITAENRKAIIDPWKKYMNSEKKKKEDESLEKETRHEQSLSFHDLILYDPLYKWLTQGKSEDVVQFFDGLDINLINEPEIAALTSIFDTTTKGSLELVKAAMTIEINQTYSPETLFRRNSISSKLVTGFVRKHGMPYILNLVKDYLKEIIETNKFLEIDPTKINPDADVDAIAKENGQRLSAIGEVIMRKLYDSKTDFPVALRVLFAHAKDLAEIKFPGTGLTIVGAVFFLRLLCPAFVSPDAFGIVTTKPPSNASRSLILMTKAFLNIANKVVVTKKELFMDRMSEFTERNIPPAFEFLQDISDIKDLSFENTNLVTLDISTLQTVHRLCRKSVVKAGFGDNKGEVAIYIFKMLGLLAPSRKDCVRDTMWDDHFTTVGLLVYNIVQFNHTNHFTSLMVLEPLCRYILIPNLMNIIMYGLDKSVSIWEVVTTAFGEEKGDVAEIIKFVNDKNIQGDKSAEMKFSIFVCKLINARKLDQVLREFWTRTVDAECHKGGSVSFDAKFFFGPHVCVYIEFLKKLEFDLHLSMEAKANSIFDKDPPKVIKVIEVEAFDMEYDLETLSSPKHPETDKEVIQVKL